MRLHFTVTTLPELRRLSFRHRIKLVYRARRQLLNIRTPGFALMVLGAAVIGLFIFRACEAWADHLPAAMAVALKPLGVVLVLALLWPALTWFDRKHLRAALRKKYPDGRISECLDCDYDLRGSASETCPECGAPVRRLADQGRDQSEEMDEPPGHR